MGGLGLWGAMTDPDTDTDADEMGSRGFNRSLGIAIGLRNRKSNERVWVVGSPDADTDADTDENEVALSFCPNGIGIAIAIANRMTTAVLRRKGIALVRWVMIRF